MQKLSESFENSFALSTFAFTTAFIVLYSFVIAFREDFWQN